MHILVAILGIVGAVSYYWFFIRRANDAASEVIDAAGRARGAYRRRSFKKKVEGSPITAIKDPRTAAVVMAVAVAGGDRHLSQAQEETLTRLMTDVLDIAETEEELVFAKWVVREIPDPNNISLRLGRLWTGSLDMNERRELVDLVTDVAGADGGLNHLQVEAIDRLKSRLAIE
ncbi:TerB family tellurite resistance protein [Hoeflea sp. WL0058]|uniref:TerB family tellurite resistance protein n=1 Tax=Flavimaribacter sediminis TaxID=2865987 RepID=A0AAE3D267_9HYPH|nr:TerB family tellurite resistance protein [Flavimaribacter sediminis]MBW8640415.1 TerB family tellurite resistance protein [Flavimaribacter sediminis]